MARLRSKCMHYYSSEMVLFWNDVQFHFPHLTLKSHFRLPHLRFVQSEYGSGERKLNDRPP